MLKTLTKIATIYCFLMINLQASLQVMIPVRDFCAGNSLVLIARDGKGGEQLIGSVLLSDGKTKFSYDEISCNNDMFSSISEQQSRIVGDLDQYCADQQDDSIIYLYFDVDPNSIVRVIVIKNNFLADNPYNVLEFSAIISENEDEWEDDEDDFFADLSSDELSNFNLTDIQGTQPVELSQYDSMMLTFYALWAIQSEHAKQLYKKFITWMSLHDAQ